MTAADLKNVAYYLRTQGEEEMAETVDRASLAIDVAANYAGVAADCLAPYRWPDKTAKDCVDKFARLNPYGGPRFDPAKDDDDDEPAPGGIDPIRHPEASRAVMDQVAADLHRKITGEDPPPREPVPPVNVDLGQWRFDPARGDAEDVVDWDFAEAAPPPVRSGRVRVRLRNESPRFDPARDDDDAADVGVGGA